MTVPYLVTSPVRHSSSRLLVLWKKKKVFPPCADGQHSSTILMTIYKKKKKSGVTGRDPTISASTVTKRKKKISFVRVAVYLLILLTFISQIFLYMKFSTIASGKQEVHQENEDSFAHSVLARFKNMKKKEFDQRYNHKVSSSSMDQNYDRPKCMDTSSKECNIDEIGRYLESSSLFTMIHLPNDAIPKNRRIPKHKAGDDAYIRDRRDIGPKTGSQTALVDYNPSILPLSFQDWDQKLLDDITGRYHPDFTK